MRTAPLGQLTPFSTLPAPARELVSGSAIRAGQDDAVAHCADALTLGQLTAFKSSSVPEVRLVQIIPPFARVMIVPFRPTATQVRAFAQLTSVKSIPAPSAKRSSRFPGSHWSEWCRPDLPLPQNRCWLDSSRPTKLAFGTRCLRLGQVTSRLAALVRIVPVKPTATQVPALGQLTLLIGTLSAAEVWPAQVVPPFALVRMAFLAPPSAHADRTRRCADSRNSRQSGCSLCLRRFELVKSVPPFALAQDASPRPPLRRHSCSRSDNFTRFRKLWRVARGHA